jgi:hypothetical protein
MYLAQAVPWPRGKKTISILFSQCSLKILIHEYKDPIWRAFSLFSVPLFHTDVSNWIDLEVALRPPSLRVARMHNLPSPFSSCVSITLGL